MKKNIEIILILITTCVIILKPFINLPEIYHIDLKLLITYGFLIILSFYYIIIQPVRDPVIIHLLMITGLAGLFLHQQDLTGGILYKSINISMIAASYLFLTSEKLNNLSNKIRNILTFTGVFLFLHGGFLLSTIDFLNTVGKIALYGFFLSCIVYYIIKKRESFFLDNNLKVYFLYALLVIIKVFINY